ncbi:MAG TPA: SEC-C metal-binding domain-containing protein, partial [Propionibacteriaceae bacterium]|nr:SEC-C metal-binding domain-containing protein [Propionibacteriaceae bacterium]
SIVEDVVDRHENGQPVLLGTASVAKSEVISGLLKKAGVPHQVLNAKHHEREAAIVAMAGRKGAVTVATNMAGRGTDIMLGGNAEFLADAHLRQRGLDPVETPDEYEAAWPATLADLEGQVADEHNEVVAAGGLYVIGSERHESRRIDNQLRGRSGRQGDPGESRFFLSLGDDLMRLFKSEVVERAMATLKVPDDVPLEHKWISNSIESAQKQVEGQNFEIRKNVLKYDDVMNRQRHAIYADRRKVLEGHDVEAELRETVDRVVEAGVRSFTEGFTEEWDLETLWTQMRTLFPVTLDMADYEGSHDAQELVDDFLADAHAAYDRREEQLGEENMRELERQVLLTVLDRKWREHLYEMDYLREGIGLRSMAQRDPLVEYQREGGQMFSAMMESFMEEVVGFLFNLEVQVQPRPAVGIVAGSDGGVIDTAAIDGLLSAEAGMERVEAEPAVVPEPEPQTPERPHIQAKGLGGRPARPVAYSAPDEQGQVETARPTSSGKQAFANVGRNQPCPCGSGKKFKVCHGRAQG